MDIQPDYKVKEVCTLLACDHKTVYSLIELGVLRGYKVGTQYRIRRDSIDKLREGAASVRRGE